MQPRIGRGVALLAVATLLVACGGGGGGDDDGGSSGDTDAPTTTTTEAAAALPDECPTDLPVTVGIEGGEALPGIDGATFEATHAATQPFPIVPDPDQELGPAEAVEQGEETDLVGYSVYLTDFAFDADDVGLLGITPPDDGTVLVLSVVPPTLDGLAVGDTITAGQPDYDTFSTLATVSTLYDTGTVEDHPFLSTTADDEGTVEIIHLDDDWLCVRWTATGQINDPSGEPSSYAIDEVVAGRLLSRASLPFS